MLAPMEGVGHPAFRQLVAEKGGVGVVCTEFVRVSRAPLHVDSLRRAVQKVPGIPLSVQVMGNDADKMAEAASVMGKAGADVVDINLGCPMPRVVRKGVGAAMLKNPGLLAEVLIAMRRAVPGVLSAKIRAGFDDSTHAVQIARVVEASGVDYIVVHPRRRCDFYEGVADWRIIRTLKQTLSIPVVGNGDVWYAADALRMMNETGCDAVMLGRPVMRNPWIFRQIDELQRGVPVFAPTGDDLFQHLRHVRQRYVTAFGDDRLGKLKELVRWFGRAVHDDGVFKKEALRAQDTDALMSVAEKHLRSLPAAKLDVQRDGHLQLEKSGRCETSRHH